VAEDPAAEDPVAEDPVAEDPVAEDVVSSAAKTPPFRSELKAIAPNPPAERARNARRDSCWTNES
jgi:hypothetical protein